MNTDSYSTGNTGGGIRTSDTYGSGGRSGLDTSDTYGSGGRSGLGTSDTYGGSGMGSSNTYGESGRSGLGSSDTYRESGRSGMGSSDNYGESGRSGGGKHSILPMIPKFAYYITDSTMGKLMEKAGSMLKNPKMEEKGMEKREQAGRGGSDNY